MSRVLSLGFIPPQLPTLTEQPPEGANWIHEIKHDGFRTILVIERGAVHAYTRNGHDWSERYPSIVARAKGLPCRSAILDGEVIVQDERGASDFEALQSSLRKRGAPLIFYAFDLLHLDGRDCRDEPLAVRRRGLKKLIEPDPQSVLQFSEEFIGDGRTFFKACAKHQLEGIVSKLATAPYRSGGLRPGLRPSASPKAS
jgi:bifunctional non-homologous end joining protein LigD